LDACRLVGIIDVVSPNVGSLTIYAKHDVVLVGIPFFTDFLYIVINMLIKRCDKNLVIDDVINGYIYILKREPPVSRKISMKYIITAIYKNNIILVKIDSIHQLYLVYYFYLNNKLIIF
jgi:hypothetical protein